MLVLTRRVNETILIGDDIAVTVVSVQGRGPRAQIRLGIAAPRETPVMRSEVIRGGSQGRGTRSEESTSPVHVE